jgi:hypothetical protein
MKKFLFTVGMILMGALSFPNNTTKTPQFFSNQTLVHIEYNDSTRTFVVEDIETSMEYSVSFYDIERLVINNVKGNRILVTDMKGKVIIDTTDSVDMAVPHGNYKIYSGIEVNSKYKAN